jgi:hypothetical protein
MHYPALVWRLARWVLRKNLPRPFRFLTILVLVLPYKCKATLLKSYWQRILPEIAPADPLGLLIVRGKIRPAELAGVYPSESARGLDCFLETAYGWRGKRV